MTVVLNSARKSAKHQRYKAYPLPEFNRHPEWGQDDVEYARVLVFDLCHSNQRQLFGGYVGSPAGV